VENLGGPDQVIQWINSGIINQENSGSIKAWVEKYKGEVPAEVIVGLSGMFGSSAQFEIFISGRGSAQSLNEFAASVRTKGLDAATRFGFNDATLNYYARHPEEIDNNLQPEQAQGIRDIFNLVKYQTASNPNPGFWSNVGMGGNTLVTSIINGSIFHKDTAKSAVNIIPQTANGLLGLLVSVQCLSPNAETGCFSQAIRTTQPVPMIFDVNCDGSIINSTRCAGGEITGVVATSFIPIPRGSGTADDIARGTAAGSDEAAAVNRAAIDALNPPASTAQLTANQIIIRAPGTEIRGSTLAELAANGARITPENVVATGYDAIGRAVWLETGNATRGLEHILNHADEFTRMGVAQAEVPSLIMRTLREGRIVGYQGVGTGRPIYQVMVNGVQQRIAITVGNNGFIVGANSAGRVR
jgi:hypothetical protein